MEASPLFHRRQSSFQFAERRGPIRDLAAWAPPSVAFSNLQVSLLSTPTLKRDCAVAGRGTISAPGSDDIDRTGPSLRFGETAPPPAASLAGGAERR